MTSYGSLFAGIKGDKGFDDAGYTCSWAVEIDPFCQSIIRTHYPSLPLFPDARTCGSHNLSPVDVITAGFPCQDLSVAGKRHGLDGHRSSLVWEVCRIARELRPAWLLLENVPGLFSSRGGKDFAAILRGLGNLGCFQSIAWRVLDSRWFGVAQRRRRVFLVASARKGGAEEVLFEPQSCGGNPAESPETRPYLAGPLGGGAYGTGRRDEDDPNLAVTISSSAGHHGHSSPRGDGSDNLVAHCLTVPSSDRRYDPSGEDFIVTAPLNTQNGHAINAEDAAGHHIVATLNSGGNSGGFRTEPGEHLVACSFAENQRGELRTSTISPQLSCTGGKPGSGYPAVAFTERTRSQGRTFESSPELAYALTNPGSGGRTHSRQIMTPHMYVRRLTPTEAEILQGFPKGWTIPSDTPVGDNLLPLGLDSARYRALGNAWTVQVGRWLAKRILNAHHHH